MSNSMTDKREKQKMSRLWACYDALKMLFTEDVNYIITSHLGNPLHNESMKRAKKAIDDMEALP